MELPLFSSITNTEKVAAIEKLVTQSTPRQDFFVMMIISVLLAVLGLIMNNVAVIIGSMLVAPILYPILSMALGIVMSDSQLIMRSFQTFIKGFSIALVASVMLVLLFFNSADVQTAQILDRAYISWGHFLVAIFAGFAASLATVKPNLNEMLPGVAIAVALVPPLATIGVGLATFNWGIAVGAFFLFAVNSFGVVLASMVIFSLMNFYAKKEDTDRLIKKEDAELRQEEERAIAEESGM